MRRFPVEPTPGPTEGWSEIEYRGSLVPERTASALELSLDPWPPAQLVAYPGAWRAALEVGGADARKWLNGMISANVRDLAPGAIAPSFRLDPKGRVLGTLDIACSGPDSFILLSDESQREALLAGLRKFVFVSKVRIDDVSEALASLLLRGPGAEAAWERLAAVAPAAHVWRRPEGGVAQVEALGSQAALRAWWSALREANPPALRGGAADYERDRTLHAMPAFGVDITEAELAQETDQLERLDYTKGCYVGQEIVERIRARGGVHRRWSRIRFPNAVVAGAALAANGAEVGRITSAAQLDSGGWRALGYLRKPHDAPGTAVTAGELAGQVEA